MKRIASAVASLSVVTLVAYSQDVLVEETAAFRWPPSLRTVGDGYPSSGDACRRVGETPATSNFLDDSAVLVGCPGAASSAAAQALLRKDNASIVSEVDGVTLITIASASMAEAASTRQSDSTAFSGSITGSDIMTHRFIAREGQTINITLEGQGTIYFNVLPPDGGPSDAIFVGSRDAEGDFFAGVAPATGGYSILVYLMGNDRDSGATRSYTLEVIAE